MNIKTNLFKNARLSFLKLSTLLLVFAFSASVTPQHLYAAAAKSVVTIDSAEDENFDKKFREGRDLLDKQEWKKAAEKFSEVINQYPDNKSVDAALYWLAFCYKKQRSFEKVGATVDRLIKDYPSSSWTSDARVLLIEVAQPAKIIYGTATQGATFPDGQGGTITVANTYSTSSALKPSQPLTITSVSPADSYAVFNGLYPADVKTPLDREDEIKIAAFQSLLSADSKKAVEAMGDILKPDSKANEALKIEVLRVVRRPRGSRTIIASNLTTSVSLGAVISDTTPLREILTRSYQNNSNVKIRREIIYVLSSLKDEQSINELTEIYKSESDLEIKKAIINGFSSSWASLNGFYSFNTIPDSTIMVNGVNNSGQSINTVKATSANSPVVRIETMKLLDIARTEKNPELRGLAIESLVRFSGNTVKSESPDYLSQIYDKETVESVKRTIILGLAKSNQPQATKKLLDIAKTEESKNLRIEAIRALGQSKDPEALKYLEEIIK